MTTSPSRHDRVRSADVLPARPWHLLVLSARSELSLEAATRNLVEHLQRNRDLDIADVAFTLQAGRQLFEHRRTAVCRDLAEAIEALGSNGDPRVHTVRHTGKQPRVAFVFSGEAPSGDTTRALYRTEAVFAREIDLLAEELRSLLGLDLRRLLDLGEEPQETARGPLRDAGGTQAARFAVEYAVAKMWQAWGVAPAAVMGYGTGEYACACLAGVIELQDAAALAVTRGRVLSGELEQTAFVKLTKSLRHHPPQLPCVSSVTGAWMPETEAGDPSYWLRQLQWASTVEAGVRTLAADGIAVLLQVGPGDCLPQDDKGVGEIATLCLRSLPGPQSQQSDLRGLTEALGHLYAAGVPIDWSAFCAGRQPHRTPLPSYAFERHRCWFASESLAGSEKPPEATRGPDARMTCQRQPVARRSRPNFANTPVPSRNQVEKTLVEICQTLLGVEGVGVYDNVVELGADSLFTMQLSRQIGETFGVAISPHHLFVEPNIASLASKIQHSGPLNIRFDQKPEAEAADRPASDRATLADYERILTFVEGLSEAQVEEMLLRMAD